MKAQKIILLLGLMILSAAGIGATSKPVQDVFIFAPDELAPGTPAAFRVVVMEARGLKDSRPVAGAEVVISLEGGGRSEQLLKSKTDADGTLSDSAKVPEVKPGDDYQLTVKVSSPLGQEEKKHSVRIKSDFRVLLSADKPLYQPGQTIHLRAVALHTSDLKPVAKNSVTLEVEDPQGNKVFKKAGATDQFGIFAADFILADEIRLGEYRIRARIGEYDADKTVTVKKYVLPKFKVVLDTDKSYYKPGEKLSGTVSANYFFGKPVDSGEVSITAQAFDVEFHTVAEVTGKTDAQGNFQFSFELPTTFVGQPLEKGDAFIKLEAKVKDNAEHTESALLERKVAASDLRLELVPEAGRLIPGVENKIYAVVTTPDDKPIQAKVKIKAGDKEYSADSDDSGVAELSFIPAVKDFKDAGGNYTLTVAASAEDKKGNKVTISSELSADNLRDSILLRTDRATYTAGDEMKINVLSTFKTGTVYLDLIRNRRAVLTRTVDLKDGRGADKIALGPDLFGTLEAHAYIILPSGEIMRDTRVVYVSQADDLKVSVSLDKQTYKPGEEAKLIFKVTDKKGASQAAALGIAVVDESVFAIQDMQPGLLKVYFTLEKELATPRYEVHFKPGNVEAMIQEEPKEQEKKDRLLRVLMAGVKNPTSPGWQENPAQVRIQSDKQNMHNYGTAFYAYTLNYQFLQKDKAGKWQFKPGITEDMIKQNLLPREQAYDSFGEMYSPETLTILYPESNPDTVAQFVAAARLLQIYDALRRYAYDEKSWMDKLFNSEQVAQFPENILQILVDKKYLDKAVLTDPWGKLFILKKLNTAQDNPDNPWSSLFRFYDLRSVGPDGKSNTDDDFTFKNLSYTKDWMLGGGGPEDMMLDAAKVIPNKGGGMLMMAEQGMPMPAAAPMAMDKAEMAGVGAPVRPTEAQKQAAPVTRVREYFPETLWWEPALLTDASGLAKLTIPMADSITTWRLTALANSAGGLLGSSASGIKVFQDFFVDIDFPVQLTQGDEVEVPVAVYNYLPGAQEVTLEVKEHPGFDLLSAATAKLTLATGQVDVRYFRVKAGRLGKQTLTVYALGPKMSDAVKRSVEVVPNGLRVEAVKNGRVGAEVKETIDIPDFAIADASRLMVKIYPGVFAQVLEGLDGIFRMPSGCFEQTTSTTYPNVMVLSYMKKTKIISPEIQMKAEGFINLGYQRLLSFEVPGGGFEWFGNPPANKVLTAYGLMEFYDMSQVYNIDENVIKRTQDWLAGKQEQDGSWKPEEHWMETLSGDAFSRSVELNTAYIAWSLAETKYKGDALKKGSAFLKSHIKEVKDAYTLALAVNALIAADKNDKEAKEILQKLDEIKIEDKNTGTIHWEPAGKTAVNGAGKSGMIETTSLILYAMIKAGQSPATANKGLAWLSQQKDAFGTFESTQATILSFKALLAAEEGKNPKVQGDILVSLKDREEKVKITPADSDVLRLLDFKDQTGTGRHEVTIKGQDDIGMMYQVAGIFYIPWDKVKKDEARELIALDLKYDRTALKTDDVLTATVNADYRGEKATEMVILDLGLPPGFSLIPDALDKLKEQKTIEKYTTTGRQLTVYVRRMEKGKPLTFSYQLKAKFPVKAQTPKSTAYEYYNPEIKTETRPVEIIVNK